MNSSINFSARLSLPASAAKLVESAAKKAHDADYPLKHTAVESGDILVLTGRDTKNIESPSDLIKTAQKIDLGNFISTVEQLIREHLMTGAFRL